MGWVFLVLVAIVCIVPSYIQYKRKEEIETKGAIVQQEYKNQNQNKYDIAKREANLPTQLNTVTIIEHGGGLMYYLWTYYIWKNHDSFCMFPASIHGNSTSTLFERNYFTLSEDRYKVIEIPLNKIMFYRQVGEVYTTVSGSGGESSFSPVTGFHGKINPIKIESEVHDERSTQLFYDDGTKDCVLVLQYNDYYTLRKLFPYKDFQVVTESLSTTVQDEIELKLAKLKNLHDKKLISDEEYANKKKDILNGI